jgi:hypothetical protein
MPMTSSRWSFFVFAIIALTPSLCIDAWPHHWRLDPSSPHLIGSNNGLNMLKSVRILDNDLDASCADQLPRIEGCERTVHMSTQCATRSIFSKDNFFSINKDFKWIIKGDTKITP